jgi:hypothetical protein
MNAEAVCLILPDQAVRVALRIVRDTADFAEASCACPWCGSAVLRVQGTGRRVSSDDQAWEADAVAMCCQHSAGTIRAEADTLFGLAEDNRVLRLGLRVF